MTKQETILNFLSAYGLTFKDLHKLSNVPMVYIFQYVSVGTTIDPEHWVMIKSAIVKHKSNPIYKSDLIPSIIIPDYVLSSLKGRGNTLILIHKVFNKEQVFIDRLKELGYDCRLYSTGDNHYIIEDKSLFVAPGSSRDYTIVVE